MSDVAQLFGSGVGHGEVPPPSLPVELTSFVGRDEQVAEVVGLMAHRRFVTLVGAGGSGKTRLALRVAAELADRYPDGVWWTDLAVLSDPDLVPQAVLTAVGLLDTRGQEPLERLIGHVAHRRALIVVDNCEHVLASAAGLLDGVLRSCPNVTALATSREPLGVPGELAWKVPPLSLPDDDRGDPLACESVQLFVERAREARASFSFHDPAEVAAICSRLDGLPLAIELAAARVRALSLKHILDGLADRFRLLTGGARTAVARHQTLQACVEWSHDLLSDAERVLFRRLGVFSGSFGLEAAEHVCVDDALDRGRILDLLSDLVDKSLAGFDGERYRLLQTIADFARGQLVAASEADVVRARHFDFFLARAEAAAAELEAAPRPELLARTEQDHDNLRSAIEWSLGVGDHEGALRLLVALTLFWAIRGHYSESLAWYRRVLGGMPTEDTTLRARALWSLGHLGLCGIELAGGLGMPDTERAAALARQLDDAAILARALADQGKLQIFIAPDQAGPTLAEAAEAARQAGDDWALAQALTWLAYFWIFDRDRADEATPLLDELLRVGQDSPYWLAWHAVCAGMAAWHQGRLADARQALEAALTGAFTFADPELEAYTVEFLANVEIGQGDYDAAGGLVTESVERLRRSAACRQEWVELRLAAVSLAEAEVAGARRQLDALAPAVRAYGIPCLSVDHDVLVGRVALEDGDLAAAASAFADASTIAAQIDSPWTLVQTHNHRGRLVRAQGDTGGAEDLHHQALNLTVRYDLRGAAADTLEHLAALVAAGDSLAEAARLFGAAETLRQATGQRRWPLDQPSYEADLARVKTALGEEAFEAAWAAGAVLSLEEAAAYASRARGERKRPSRGWEALTPTELQVVALVAQGLSNAEIGRRLFITTGTTKVHLAHIFAKVDVNNRTELATQAIAHGIVDGKLAPPGDRPEQGV